MFSSIRSFAIAAISLLALGLPMVGPSPVHAVPTAQSVADAAYSAPKSNPSAGVAVPLTRNSRVTSLASDSDGPAVWQASRLAVGSGSPVASVPLVASRAIADGDCDSEGVQFLAALGACVITGIPALKLMKVAKGAAKAAKAGKGTKNGAKGADDDGLDLGKLGLGAMAAFFLQRYVAVVIRLA